MLLLLVGFIRLWQLTEHPNVVEEYEFPSVQVSTDSYVHVLDCCPLEPATRLLQRLDPPHASSAIETEEIEEKAIYLLLHLKMEAQVDVLESREQVLVLVHE